MKEVYFNLEGRKLESKDNKEDFTRENYKRLLKIASNKYQIGTVSGFESEDLTCLWRHDVDCSPQSALAMAKIEHQEGVCATYYFMLRSDFYNIFEPAIVTIINAIQAMGHEVGLHFDANQYDISSAEALEIALIKEKNALEFNKAINEANKQGAFVFWNHPHWEANRKDGIAKLDPIHEEIINKKLLHGIEVVNMFTFSEEALDIALENDLTILGTSDVHVLIDWDFNNERESYHRPLTFIISENRTMKSTSDALFKGDTFVWYHDLIVGKEENLKIVAENNFTATSEGYDYDFFSSAESILKVKLKNHSVAPLKLKYTGEYTFHTEFNYIDIDPRSELEIYVKTIDKLEKLVMPFEVLNYVIGSKKNLKINKNISVQ